MPYRYFIDSSGEAWRVWDVRPTLIDRRLGIRRVKVVKYHHTERRVLPTRRIDMSRSRLFFPKGETGWLCFEAGGERFRLKPFPEDWAVLTDQELESLRTAAEPRREGD